MNPKTIARFKRLFEEQREALIYTRGIRSEDFQIQRDDLLDEADATSTELEASMRLRLRNREALFVRKIDEALQRIAEGSFGLCNRCGEDIDLRRLEARPTAILCVGCKEEEERRESLHIDGHRPKSLGTKLRLRLHLA